jgi:hypothetical protein
MRVRYAFFILLLFFATCNTEEIDDEKPVIDLTIYGAFPVSCDTLYLGESFTWKVWFTDNVELGSYSLEIHHNFDHHAHSTEVDECELGPVETPVNPFHTILDFEIPAGSREYIVNQEVSLPLSDANGEFDEGDYHFFISLTDREGWSAQKGLNIKILQGE